jgi:CheY-like chemotaxis protein
MNEKMFDGVEILIAEDNPLNYTLLREMISHTGVEHFWAKNGIETLDLLDKHGNISLILMDVNMPRMDGITATRKIRERDKQIPIIFQTAYENEEDKKKCYTAGGNEFISKQFRKNDIYLLLKKYLVKNQSLCA